MKKFLLLLLTLSLLSGGMFACSQETDSDNDSWTGGRPQHTYSLGTVISVDAAKDIVVLEMDAGSIGIEDNPITFDFSKSNTDNNDLAELLPGVRVEVGYEIAAVNGKTVQSTDLTVIGLFEPVEYRTIEEVSGFNDALDIVVNYGSSQMPNHNYQYYVFELENPNTNYAISNCKFRVAGFMDEKLIYIDEVDMPKILPGEKRYVSARVGNGVAINGYYGAFSTESALWEETQQQFIQYYDVINVEAEYQEDHSKILSGEVILKEGIDATDLGDKIAVSVVFRQSDGTLVYGVGTVIENYTVGEPATFEVHCPYYMGYAPYEIYAYPE